MFKSWGEIIIVKNDENAESYTPRDENINAYYINTHKRNLIICVQKMNTNGRG